MSILKTLSDPATRKLLGQDEALKLREEAARHFNLDEASQLSDAKMTKFLDYKASQEAVETPNRMLKSALAGTVLVGGAGAGAYMYGEDQKTERYNAYQEQMATIDRLEREGKISAAEAERRREAAREAYRNANGDSNAGMSLTELIAEMSTLQLGISAAVIALIVWKLAPPLINALDNFSVLRL